MNIRSDILRFASIGALSGILSWLTILPESWIDPNQFELLESILWYMPGIPFGICMVWAINTLGLNFRYPMYATVILASLLSIISWYTTFTIGAVHTGFYISPITSFKDIILSGIIPSFVGVLIVGITLIAILKIPRRAANWNIGFGLIFTAIGAIGVYSLLRLLIPIDNDGVGYLILFVAWQTTVFAGMGYFLRKFKPA